MKNNRDTKIILALGVFLLLCVIGLVILSCLSIKGIIPSNVVEYGKQILDLLISIPIVLWIAIMAFYFLKRCIKNLYSCGDELFNELDYHKMHWGETNAHYQDMINVINFYYKEEGKVDIVIGKNLKKLYGRLEFLERGIYLREHMITCMTSAGISVCAALYFEYAFGKFEGKIWIVVLTIVLFLAVILFRYDDVFRDADNQICKYEIEKLKKKISIAEDSLKDDYQREDILLTKQYVLRMLIAKCNYAHGKKKKDIIDDIERIEKLNLYMASLSDYKELTFRIGKSDKQGVLFLDANKKMASKQYEILYSVLRKYDWIYEIEEDKN